MVAVPRSVLERYRAFSLYNSPYRAHDEGRAIDLYPDDGAPSPVAGQVVAVERVRAPPKPYAPEHDWVVAIDTGSGPVGPAYPTPAGDPAVARILHVDPAVDVGDDVAVGEALGDPIRAGFFAPWVDRHLHLGFRPPGADFLRASGSLRVEPAVDVEPVEWSGRGTVVETDETYAVLDRPEHPVPGEGFAAVAGVVSPGAGAADERPRSGARRSVPLDGGLPHYDHGGVFGGVFGGVGGGARGAGASISIAGTRVGTARWRTVQWSDPTVVADGEPIHGLSLAASRDRLGVKLICPDATFEVGESVRVEVRP